MEIDFNNVLVFATNIKTEKEKQTIGAVLNNHPSVKKWNIDLEDIDSVLRIVSDRLSAAEIIEIINNQDFKCSELQE